MTEGRRFDPAMVAELDEPVERYFTPERPEVHVRIDDRGAVRSASALRWDNGEHGPRGYIPCGGEVEAEQRFGDLVIASRVTVGWWFDTPRWAPFFEADILSAEPVA